MINFPENIQHTTGSPTEQIVAPDHDPATTTLLYSAFVYMAAQAHLNRELGQQALTDPLTGLHNRRGLDEELSRVEAQESRNPGNHALAVIDLDNFKELNDTHGHHAGDQALITVGDVLREHTRKGDFIARTGGDEFVIAFTGADERDAEKAAKNVGSAISDAFEGSSNITASIGVSGFNGQSADEVLREADAAVYEAKRKGRDRVEPHSKLKAKK
jgi:diguanylate cyclase (GGDEF)-like protein